MNATEWIKEQRALCEAATKGPWEHTGAKEFSPKQKNSFEDYGASIDGVVIGGLQDEQGGAVGIISNEDADFIASARTSLPAALDVLEAVIEKCSHVIIQHAGDSETRASARRALAEITLDIINAKLAEAQA